jgi:hypothetical protein
MYQFAKNVEEWKEKAWKTREDEKMMKRVGVKRTLSSRHAKRKGLKEKKRFSFSAPR